MGAHGGPVIVTDSSLKLLLDPKDEVCSTRVRNSTLTDLSGNLNSGSLYSGKGLYFDATSELEVGALDNPPRSGVTLMAWAYPTSSSPVVGGVIDSQGGWCTMARVGSSLNLQTGETPAAFNHGAMNIGSWNLLASTYDQAHVKNYINGALAGSSTHADGTIQGNSWTISYNGWRGYLSDVRIYNTALSLSDISTIYNKPTTVLPGTISGSQLVGWWPLTDGTGTNASDSSGNNETAAFTNSPMWISSSADLPQSALGYEYSGSVSTLNPNKGWFNLNPSGSYRGGDYILSQDIAELDGVAAITYECWVNISSRPDDWYFLIKKHAGMGIYKNPSGDYPYLEMWVASGKSAQSHADIRYNTWQHCVGVYDGTNNILTYIDGQSRTNATTAGPSTTTDDSSVLRIGRESATDKNALHGKMTSVKIYDRALSAKEILQNYNAQRSRFGV